MLAERCPFTGLGFSSYIKSDNSVIARALTTWITLMQRMSPTDGRKVDNGSAYHGGVYRIESDVARRQGSNDV